MKTTPPLFLLLCCAVSCADRQPPPDALAKPAESAATSLQSLHVRLTVNPADGHVAYFGWYDGRRNLLGESGITAALVGMEPPEFREAKLDKPTPLELRFTGLDHNRIQWEKTYRLESDSGHKVHVTYRITNRRDEAFEAIVYSLADLPDATFAGDNRDLHITTPLARAHFHAVLEDPNFPGEQMSPFAMRSDSRRLAPGASMTFQMTWELRPARSQK
jgi:hypothetical protein